MAVAEDIPGAQSRPLGGAIWFVVAAVVLGLSWFAKDIGWLKAFPQEWVLPFTDMLNAASNWVVAVFGPFFRAFSKLVEIPLDAITALLQATPWPITVALGTLVAHAAGGRSLAIFTLLSFAYILVIGYWIESMNTLSLVAISVPGAVLTGFALGVGGYLSRRAERIILPTLDLLQTIPAFAYLLPILLLFGFGPVVGLIASILYAAPPMARNTMIGLREVPPEVVESGQMSGATPSQLFWRVRLPTALPQVLLGVNQATMAAFSMVIIAAIIGGSEDIGWEVLNTMRKAQFGESLLAGLVIALMAMVMDRVTAGFAARSVDDFDADHSFAHRYRYWIKAAVLIVLGLAAAAIFPIFRTYPEALTWSPAEYLNDGISWVVRNGGWVIDAIKNSAFFFVMLPMKIGLVQSVSPFTWGFAPTPEHGYAYAAGVLVLAALATWRWSAAVGGGIALIGVIIFFGLTGVPWLAMLIAITALSWWTRGTGLAVFTFFGLLFLILAGVWDKTALSIYLCGAAVLIAFTLGTMIGIWASSSRTVSRIVRPINDTLQTMPLFVLLIPVVMLFKIGEFTALIAIVIYAIVPAIRYTEHALRNVSPQVVEAAESMGCKPRQLLWQVRIPLAMPGIMLGLNQTIMYGIAMLVIAALVGTNGLGQQVYIGLGDGDFGVGMVAGIGMAIIAIIADRMTQARG